MLQALIWWLAFLLLGLAALPLTFTLFRRLPDRGYGLSRALGLLLFAYLFWILGTVRVLPNNQGGAWIALVLAGAFSAWVFMRRRTAVLGFLRSHWRVVLATEVVFALVFALWGIMRSYSPEIAHTEQPMDFALLNGILSSPHFPPNDPWYAGEPISYYYGGYLLAASATKLTGLAAAYTYNLALASTAAMAATGIFSVVYNLVTTMRGPKGERSSFGSAVVFGGVAVFLLLFIGNPVGALEYLNANGAGSDGFWSWVSVDGLRGHDIGSTWYPNDTWWWWRSTRVINSFPDGQGIDFTITEFPFFSFMLGDLHPHVMSLPFVMVAMGLALNVMRIPGIWGLAIVRRGVVESARWGWPPMRWAAWWTGIPWRLLRAGRWDVLVAALALGALGFINSWDLPTFTGLFFIALLLRALQRRAQGLGVRWRELAALLVLFAIVEVLLFIPFYLFFDSQASGIKTVRVAQTRQIHYFLVLGPLLVLGVALLAGLWWSSFAGAVRRLAARIAGVLLPEDAGRHQWQPWAMGAAIVLPLVPFLFWAIVELGLSANDSDVSKGLLAIGSRFWHLLPVFIVLSLGLAVLFTRALRDGRASAAAQFAVLAIVLGLLGTLGAELFRISDFFNNRMNTVFKFYYQAWALLAVGGAVALAWFAARGPRLQGAARAGWGTLVGVFIVVIVAAFLYVPAAAYSKAGGFNPSPTLNALSRYERHQPEEYAAVQWLRHNARKGDVVLEGVPIVNGQPQGGYDPSVSRISRNTGLPTILGWPGHEHQWRGNPFEPILQRALDVEKIYKTGAREDAERLLDQYDVRYVVAGDLERRAYGPEVNRRLASFLKIAFQNDRVVIFSARS